MRTCAKLTGISNDRKITIQQDARFLCEFQQSVLLNLKECNILTETQFRYAAEKLKEQYLSVSRRRSEDRSV